MRGLVFNGGPVLAAASMSVVAFATVAVGAVGGAAPLTTSASRVAPGQVQLSEAVGSTTCVSTAAGSGSCRTIDDLGAVLDQAPGGAPTTTTIMLTNTGAIPTNATSLTSGPCLAAAAKDNDGFTGSDLAGYCSKVDLTLANTTAGAADKCVFPTVSSAPCPAPSPRGTLASFASRTLTSPALSALAVDGSTTYVIRVRLTAAATNADQGLTASLPLTWTISQ
jgi:hypothetical protein